MFSAVRRKPAKRIFPRPPNDSDALDKRSRLTEVLPWNLALFYPTRCPAETSGASTVLGHVRKAVEQPGPLDPHGPANLACPAHRGPLDTMRQQTTVATPPLPTGPILDTYNSESGSAFSVADRN
jgi:hypothetical protein